MKNFAQEDENVGIIVKDAYSSISPEKKKKPIDSGDAIGLIKYFRNKSVNETNFYWNIEVEDDITLINFFFRDSRCLVDYECFGDVMSFDTTYKTNKYGLICAPFVGMNHHKDNIMFGYAFLSDETESSFQWLFRTFLESMGGKQPGVIFTDQCQATMNAIETVFPDSHHRLCPWRIQQNSPSHFGALKYDSKFKSLWRKCMVECESEEEFERTWQQMMANYHIGEHNWFNIMYNLRHKWSSAFNNHLFSVGLLATSKGEGTNTALKKKIGNVTSTLMDCVRGYEEVLDDWRRKEKVNDIDCHHKNLTLWAEYNPLTKHAAAIYTHSILRLFQIEQIEQLVYQCTEVSTMGDSSLRYFQVNRFNQNRFNLVQFDCQASEITCSCHKFETSGILCRHVLRVFTQVNVKLDGIPERYIKKRWTKSVKERLRGKSQSASIGTSERPDNTFVSAIAFVNQKTKQAHELIMRSKAHVETREMLTEAFDSLCERFDAYDLKSNLGGTEDYDEDLTNDDPHGIEILVRDTPLAKSREITGVRKRHFDVKSKKERANSKKMTKGTKGKAQTSHTVVDEFPSQEILFSSQPSFTSQ